MDVLTRAVLTKHAEAAVGLMLAVRESHNIELTPETARHVLARAMGAPTWNHLVNRPLQLSS